MVARPEADHARLDDLADSVSVQQQRQPGDVILVRVGQHHHVEPAVPCRNALAEERHESVWIRTGVDQHSPAVGSLEQDRVALADVEHRHVQPTIRAGAVDQHQQHAQTGEAERGHEPRLGLRGPFVGWWLLRSGFWGWGMPAEMRRRVPRRTMLPQPG